MDAYSKNPVMIDPLAVHAIKKTSAYHRLCKLYAELFEKKPSTSPEKEDIMINCINKIMIEIVNGQIDQFIKLKPSHIEPHMMEAFRKTMQYRKAVSVREIAQFWKIMIKDQIKAKSPNIDELLQDLMFYLSVHISRLFSFISYFQTIQKNTESKEHKARNQRVLNLVMRQREKYNQMHMINCINIKEIEYILRETYRTKIEKNNDLDASIDFLQNIYRTSDCHLIEVVSERIDKIMKAVKSHKFNISSKKNKELISEFYTYYYWYRYMREYDRHLFDSVYGDYILDNLIVRFLDDEISNYAYKIHHMEDCQNVFDSYEENIRMEARKKKEKIKKKSSKEQIFNRRRTVLACKIRKEIEKKSMKQRIKSMTRNYKARRVIVFLSISITTLALLFISLLAYYVYCVYRRKKESTAV
ncbi:hypothetical protein NEMIN01_1255 [Nematocida minor]|uniref:uncharacterized protein n=1 Tax=Nematocida minor TaxID=1912983 RepID=UPI00221F9D19|nr:uncharacterized protein NEMIN01_1255 [Nematocida minor]KAI5190853.1 hypothetical protein NEMIN01_1255 [Nematocida minor]